MQNLSTQFIRRLEHIIFLYNSLLIKRTKSTGEAEKKYYFRSLNYFAFFSLSLQCQCSCAFLRHFHFFSQATLLDPPVFYTKNLCLKSGFVTPDLEWLKSFGD